MEIGKFSKYKALLDSLLKNSLDDKLKSLENRGKEHESIISTTKEITNNIAVLTLKIQEQLLLKLKEKKKNSVIKIKRTIIRNTTSPKSLIIKRRQSELRTPMRPAQTTSKYSGTKTSGNTKKLDFKLRRHMTEVPDLNKTMIEKAKTTFNNKKFKKEIIENPKLNKTFLNSFNKKFDKKKLNGTSMISLRLKDKEKSNQNLIEYFTNDNIKNKENEKKKNGNIKSRNKNNELTNKILKNNENVNDNNKSLIKRALARKKTLTSKNTLINSSKKNKFESSNSIQKLKNKKIYDSYNSTKNPNKRKQANEKNENSKKKNVILGYNDKKTKKEIGIKNEKIYDENNNKEKLISIERNLQKTDPLFSDEPLLITPITDSDFQKGVEMFSVFKDDKKNKNIIELFGNKEINIDKIFEFISLIDLIQLKSVSKFFNSKVLNYFVKNLTETKTKLIAIKNTISSISEQKNINDIKFSQGTESSIKLLNENIMTKFFQGSKPPRDDILFIFEVFFQLINKPIKDVYNNKEAFWEKCRLYFLNEGNDKIGDMLYNIVKNNKIDVSEDNLYKIYILVKDKMDIIVPSHFNKICSTTPLITFYIKDILNFLGISTDEDYIKQNGYWTYINIINSIEKKINKIKNFE